MSAKLLSQAGYARHRGVSREAVRLAVQAGRITLVKGKVDVEAADREWAENTIAEKAHRAGAKNGKAAAAGTGLAHNRSDREFWNAKLAELEYKRRLGKSLDADEVAKVTFESHRRARDRLRLITARIGALLTAEQRGMLDKEIRDACAELGAE